MTLIARLRRRLRSLRTAGLDAGMSTAEYAVRTLAAVAFAAVLYKVITSRSVAVMLNGIIDKALSGFLTVLAARPQRPRCRHGHSGTRCQLACARASARIRSFCRRGGRHWRHRAGHGRGSQAACRCARGETLPPRDDVAVDVVTDAAAQYVTVTATRTTHLLAQWLPPSRSRTYRPPQTRRRPMSTDRGSATVWMLAAANWSPSSRSPQRSAQRWSWHVTAPKPPRTSLHSPLPAELDPDELGDPCGVALRIASANGATLTLCQPEGDTVRVEVSRKFRLPGLGEHLAKAHARAGLLPAT